ncbi:glycoside hydrolase family 18 protein [Marinilabilia rubra]|uniref:chitinase n=1 Tax=Marinilabilia rubra TaxID=2162893 RepID=A0A2U2B7Y2_9BACT|nr:glycoside hydrolase family 18 protein [Marinilabilia rubra]PWD99153.1 glycoside hydrolase [Marinilabilia rubra]
MKNIAFLIFAIWTFIACSSSQKPPKRSSKVVIGYLFPGNRLIKEDISASKLTHINYAFANIIDGRMVEGYEADSANFAVLNRLKRKNSALKILVSVGGWGWSGEFSDMALNKESRRHFVESAVDFLLKHNLDGLDIDWEYPGMPGAGNTHRPQDKENFTLLLKECREALDAIDRSKHYLLTIAAAASPVFLETTDMDKAAQYLDFVNLMTYDFAGAWDSIVRHHANLYPSEFYEGGNSVSETVDRFISDGVPADKLVVGVPFYGRGWKKVKKKNSGLGGVGEGLENVNLVYQSILENVLSNKKFEKHWDNSAKAPYLFNEEERVFITYENPKSLGLKCQYIRNTGLKGVMFWEYFDDSKECLLSVINTELHRRD